MRTITFLALCCAAPLLSCTESTAPTAPTAGISAAAASAPAITITDLGTLPGGGFSAGSAINARGDIVGRAGTATGEQHAVVWRDGTIIDLGTLGGTYGQANAINAAGQVVGRATTSVGTEYAFLWERGRMASLGAPPGAASSVAMGINPAGMIVAIVETRLATWERSTWTVLPYPTEATDCSGGAIDNAGRVVGYCSMATNHTRSFIWQGGVPTDLGSLGSGDVAVTAISPSGTAVGFFSTENGSRPFLWVNGTITDLTTQGANASFVPAAINAAGLIVGTIYAGNSHLHAAVWRRGTTIDLGTLPGGADSYAYGINASGKIAGTSYNASGVAHSTLWTLR